MVAPACPLSPFPPDGNPEDDHQAGKEQPLDPCESGGLRKRERQVAAGLRLRANRDHVFVLSEPVDRVEEQIAIAAGAAEDLILGEIGVADYHQASALIVARWFAGSYAKRERAELVGLRIILNLVLELRLG